MHILHKVWLAPKNILDIPDARTKTVPEVIYRLILATGGNGKCGQTFFLVSIVHTYLLSRPLAHSLAVVKTSGNSSSWTFDNWMLETHIITRYERSIWNFNHRNLWRDLHGQVPWCNTSLHLVVLSRLHNSYIPPLSQYRQTLQDVQQIKDNFDDESIYIYKLQ